MDKKTKFNKKIYEKFKKFNNAKQEIINKFNDVSNDLFYANFIFNKKEINYEMPNLKNVKKDGEETFFRIFGKSKFIGRDKNGISI